MKLALLADIHANLPALEAVIDDINSRGDIAVIYHLGDLVGYAPWPNEVVELLDARDVTGVAGNYDSTVAADYAHCGCRSENPRQEALAHASFEWTKEHVSQETRRRLAALPFRVDASPASGHTSGPRAILVHGTPTLNTLYWDADRSDSFCRRMIRSAGAREGDLIACGHTHIPWRRIVDGVHLLNAGSVGRPKDGDPRACYAVVALAATGPEIEIVRVTYDVERARRGLVGSGLPPELADDLATGATASSR